MTRWGLLLVLLAASGCAAPSAALGPPRSAPPASWPAPASPPGVLTTTAEEAAPGLEEVSLDHEDEEGEEGEGVADVAEPAPRRPAAPPNAPVLKLTAKELEEQYRRDPASLGSMSVGHTNAGLLVNGVQMPEGARWKLVDPGRAWGTRETIDALIRCIDRVNEKFPDAPPIPIGHISAKNGGHLSPHVSHQSGRDVDIGYYYRTPNPRWFMRATEANLDLPKTWALVKAAIKETDIEMILVDHSIQRLLADHALRAGEDPSFVDEVFQVRGKNRAAVVRHVKGHATHIHFRFHNPVAEELGRRAYHLVPHPHPPAHRGEPAAVASTTFAQHRARSGDTLVILAKRYGTTVEEIQRANGLKTIALRAGVVYRIPTKAPARPAANHRPTATARKGPAKPAGRGRSAPQR